MTDPTASGPSGFRSPGEARRPTGAELLAARIANADQRRRASAESDRRRFWFAFRIAATCVCACLVSLFLMGWALHTTDMDAARLAWAAGPVFGQTIILTTLVYGWIRWSRDEW